jgi:xanthosine utilization system XapX-like protein
MPISERRFYFVCGTLMLLGGVVFLWGGIQHPPTDPSLGAIGSDEYFRNFIREIVQHHAWERIHTAILVGPLGWALGGVGVCLALRRRGESCFSALGAAALAMGATAWAVTFVFDGFAALRYAEAISGNSPDDMTSLLVGFRANQVVVIRLGLVSLVLIGIGMVAFGASMFGATGHSRPVLWLLGVSGILVGSWPIVAWATGVFDPGPFTSRWWKPTALLTAVWFMSAGIAILAEAARAPMSGRPRANESGEAK